MIRPLHPLGTLLLVASQLLPGAPAAAQAAAFTNMIGMEFVRVPAGVMTAGRFQPECPESQQPPPDADPRTLWSAEDHRRCEETVARESTPGFQVRFEQPFHIGRYEVTQEQWQRVMGSNPSFFQGRRIEGSSSRHPVERVLWEDAVAFARRLSELDPAADYRLPTEMEWEYAARAGAQEEPSWRAIRESGWIAQVDRGTTHPVGEKVPNPWGLYDTLGNVWEWVADWYNDETLPGPLPPQTGQVHVLRGGGFLSDVKNATWFTHAGGPGNGWDVGVRLVMEPER